MGKVSPKKIEQLVRKGRLVPLIDQQNDGKHYLVGYARKSSSRKSDRFMLPQPELINVPDMDKE
jgi:hypothetical protein